MDSKKKVSISWSGGKDSALALNYLLRSGEFEVVSLHTLFDKETCRVGMHGIPEALVEKQAHQLGIPLIKLYLVKSQTNQTYENLLKDFYQSQVFQGVTHIAFGDLFLEDLKVYREKLLSFSGLIPVFPLWKMDTGLLMETFIKNGFKTILCSVNQTCFEAGLLGRMIDDDFVSALPEGVDLCGENGEYHTFVFDGPEFRQPVPYTLGEEIRKRYDYHIADEAGNIHKQVNWFYFRSLESPH